MGLKEKGWQSVDWLHLAEGMEKWLPLVKAVMNIRSPKDTGNFLIISGIIFFSRRPLLHRVSQLIS
jgi:hypothetical protein